MGSKRQNWRTDGSVLYNHFYNRIKKKIKLSFTFCDENRNSQNTGKCPRSKAEEGSPILLANTEQSSTAGIEV